MKEVNVNNNLISLAFFGMASIGLSGCMINVDDGHSSWESSDKWQQTQQSNREKLSMLSLGMSKEQVITLMGTADFNEAFIEDGKEVHVLFYRTQRMKGDGKTTKDECTSLVIRENALVGWGDKAYTLI
ncbi:DUF3192 domain-containing protein [Shewanella youngdeokensis]|uniref:DUF3192 domain-containing protein n=1 Tax=Shewanella youngdeokensis TaxID=2999068 RepID=A0ABZ0JVC5_9GAMM|nr:DUF3192 domain-containing protein [Shewanella sp. DAU334]